MALTTKSLGIHQSEIIIRSALQQGLAEMRAKPWLLDYCFASLPLDTLTQKDYGQSLVDQAKAWFLQQDIPVKMNSANQPPTTFPAISIQLVSSVEDAKTHGDIHYEPFEDSDIDWPVLYGPFDAVSYNPMTGVLVLPTDVVDSIVLGPGQLIIDRIGGIHQILSVNDERTVVVETNAVGDFSGAVIKGQKPAYVAHMESVVFQEQYQIGVHCQGQPEQLTWLHSIVTFILLAYKQTLLEARNFERSTISSSDFNDNPFLGGDSGELIYSRFITITGFVRQMWPGNIAPKATAVEVQPVIVGGGVMHPSDTVDELDQESWIGDGDIDSFNS